MTVGTGALQVKRRRGKREVDVPMLGGGGNKEEEGPRGCVMGIVALLTSAPGSTGERELLRTTVPGFSAYTATSNPMLP